MAALQLCSSSLIFIVLSFWAGEMTCLRKSLCLPEHLRALAGCLILVLAIGCERSGNRVVGDSGQHSPESVADQLLADQAASEVSREE